MSDGIVIARAASQLKDRTAPTDSDRIEAHVWRLSAVVLIGSVMSILDTTIVNIAVATLGRELHSTVADIQWVVTGYVLAPPR
jgi:fucose permease